MFTAVSFHAHPDDEALLCGGTLARAAADGHRVVIVYATDGSRGLTGAQADPAELGATRRAEARAAAVALGAARVEFLGYADAGSDAPADPPTAGPPRFVDIEPAAAAARLAAILTSERADLLTIYDARGGYGHPDHLRVHEVGVLAGALAHTRVVLEATVDRTQLWRAARWAAKIPGVPADFGAVRIRDGYTAPEFLTHRVDVRSYAPQKRAAMAAHRSQTAGGVGARTLAVFLRVPGPVFRAVFGHEWFVERGRPAAQPLCDDIFDSLRGTPAGRGAPAVAR